MKKNFAIRNVLLVLLLSIFGIKGEGQTLYWKTDGTSGTWTGANWSTTGSDPFTTSWISGANAVFNATSSVTFATTTVGDVTVNNSSTVTILQAGTLTFTGGTVHTYNIGSGSSLTWSGQGVTTNSGAGIIKSGSGTLDLGGLTWSTNMNGGFTLNDGKVIVSGSKALGNGSLTFNGGILESSGSRSFTPTSLNIGGNFSFSGTGNSNWDAATTIALGSSTRTISNNATNGSRQLRGLISGSSGAGLTFDGAGAAQIYIGNTSNTFSGPVTLNGSEVVFNDDGSFGTGNSINIDGGRLTVATMDGSGNLSSTNSATINSNRTIFLGNTLGTSISIQGDVTTFNGIIADKPSTSGILTKQGAGTLILGGVNIYTGSTAINNGALKLTLGSNRLPTNTLVSLGQSSSGNLGTLDINGQNQTIGGLSSISGSNTTTVKNIVTSSSSATLTINSSSSTTYGVGTTVNSGIITGAISIVKSGTGIQTFGDANTYTGTTTINGGSLNVSSDANLGASPANPTAGNITLNGGTLAATATFTLSSNRGITLGASNGTIDVASGVTLTYAGIAVGSGGLTKTSQGTLTLAGANTFTGTFSASRGTTYLNSNNALGRVNSVIVSSNGTIQTGVMALTDAINNSAGITINGSGKMDLSGASETVGSLSSNSASSLVIGDNAGTSGSFTVGDANNTTFAGVISGSRSATGAIFTKQGSGTLILSGDNTYIGTTTINQGILQISAAERISNSSNFVLSGGTFSTGATIGFSETVGTLDLAVSTASTIALGSGDHTLTFSNSSSLSPWGTGATLTITGWTGTAGQSNTSGGKIFFGNSSTRLTTAQLAKISFSGYSGSAILLSTGELVPSGPSLAVTNGSLNHGSSCVNAPASSITYTVTNTGASASGVTVTSNNPEFVVSNLSSTTISGGGGTITYQLTFTPTGSGTRNATITINTTTVNSNSPVTSSVTGSGTPISTAAILSGATTICSGNSTNLQVAITGGTSPYTVVYTDGTNNFTVNNYTSSSNIPVSPTSTKTYSLISVTTADGCVGTGNSGSAKITVNSTPNSTTASATGPTTFCTGGSVILQSQRSTSIEWYKDGIATGVTSANFTASVAGVYTVVVTASSGCSSASNAITVTVTSTNTWTGTTSDDWSIASNWCSGQVPDGNTNAIIPSGANTYPILSGNSPVKNIEIQAGAVVTLSGKTLTINGIISGTGTLRGSRSSELVISGSGGSGTIYFDQSNDSVRNVLSGLTLNRAGTISLSNKLYVLDLLTLTQGTLNTNGNLVLRSIDSTKTARVAPVTGTIQGDVTVERYISSKRAYRFVTPSVVTNQSIQSAWMEGQNNTATGYANNSNTKPGYGTHITGAGGATNGFDQTLTNNPSLFVWDNGSTQMYSAVANVTSSGALIAGKGYRLFIRGSRSIDLSNNAATPSSTILRATGSLITGTVTFNTSSTVPLSNLSQGYSFLGNPYVSPVRWSSLQRTNVTSTYSTFDPRVNVRGAFVYYNATSHSSNNSSSKVNDTLQSGQGFFVQNDLSAANPTLVFNESNKIAGNNPVFRSPDATTTTLSVRLLLNNSLGTQNTADGVVALFDDAFSAELGDEDSYKYSNLDENIAIHHGITDLSIEGRPNLVTNDTLQLRIWQYRQSNYFLQFDASNFNAGATLFVKDAYLNTETQINSSDSTLIPFNLTSDSASFASDRFMIVLKPGSVLPVTITDVKAFQKGKGIQVDWISRTEANISHYEVEKSANGRDFEKAGLITATGNSSMISYGWFDENPVEGNNFYRIRIVEKSGSVKYTQVVKVTIGKGNSSIAVLPNPVKGNAISLHFVNVQKGRYTISLYNNLGQQVLTRKIEHDGASATYSIPAGRLISKGTYRLNATNGESELNTTVVFE